VGCPVSPIHIRPLCLIVTDLIFLVRVEDQDIDGLELLDISVPLELLPDLGANGRNRHVQGVHLLDLRRLPRLRQLLFVTSLASFRIFTPSSSFPPRPRVDSIPI